MKKKIIIYQVMTRLFGNVEEHFTPWGTKEQNGVGKFGDFTDKALQEIKNFGFTHIWFTGVLHHALIGDYTDCGISNDHPDVVKGRAGSPYAIKDYYTVNPDLANNPARRLEEFEALIQRTHNAGMKVIIDIVPNHVARKYQSITKPEGVIDFGENDDTTTEYQRNNDFYYIPGQAYENPDWPQGYEPLGGTILENSSPYYEFPAKWTGNGSKNAKPDIHDWYETVKINYGILPDGKQDFPSLPSEFRSKADQDHFDFWNEMDVPASWHKWRQIVKYWLDKGVDGFRYDMAELVPVEFWSYLNSYIKMINPASLLIAEVYDPARFDVYISLGKMDLLYDKVDLYDTLRSIIQNHGTCHAIFPITENYYSIQDHLLHFLENHDEQRIASHQFAGDPFKALPALVLSATIDRGGMMIYFGQEVGEKAEENAGFGSSSRTSIFDYVRVPAHQRWMNFGAFDGALLTDKEQLLRDYYRAILHFIRESKALAGEFYDLHRHNAAHTFGYWGDKLYSFARYNETEKLIIICNFDAQNTFSFRFSVYFDLIERWSLEPGQYAMKNILNKTDVLLFIQDKNAFIDLSIKPLESLILQLQHKP